MLRKKAKLIKAFIFDIDGVMTSGKIYYHPDGEEMRAFHIRDGLGIKLLQKGAITPAVISGKQSISIKHRLNELKVMHSYLGYENKLPAYEAFKQTLQLNDEEIAYMGDDLPDMSILKRCGLAITVPSAPLIVKETANMITKTKAGYGAVREACEFILTAQGKFDALLKSYICDGE